MIKSLFQLVCALPLCLFSPAQGEYQWQTYEYDAFKVAFPTPPEIAKTEMQTTFLSFDHARISSVGYLLIASTLPSTHKEDPISYFERYLQSKSTYPYVLAEFLFIEHNGLPTLDLICFNQYTRLFVQERIIVSENRIYALYTTSYIQNGGNHSYFISSFRLKEPVCYGVPYGRVTPTTH